MAQSQDGRDTVQEWVHKPKEKKPRKGLSTIRVRVTRNTVLLFRETTLVHAQVAHGMEGRHAVHARLASEAQNEIGGLSHRVQALVLHGPDARAFICKSQNTELTSLRPPFTCANLVYSIVFLGIELHTHLHLPCM